MLVLFVILAATLSAGDNILKNPTLTDGNGDGIPDNWELRPAPNGTTTKIEMAAADGVNAVHIVDTDAKVGVGVGQMIPVTAGHFYRQTVRMKGSGGLKIYLNWHDENKKMIKPEHSKDVALTSAFKEYEYAEKAPAGAAFCLVWIYTTSTGTSDFYLASAEVEDTGTELTAKTQAVAAETVSEEEFAAVLGFETAAWSGIELSTASVKEGKYAGLWKDHTKIKAVSTSKIRHDLSGFEAMSLWIYSEKKTGEQVVVIFESRSDPKQFSYFSYSFTVNWAGWKEVRIPFSAMNRSRDPVGFQKIDVISFNVGGWGGTAMDESILHLDAISLKKGTAPASALKAAYVPKEVRLPAPSKETYLSLLKREHPRLLFTAADIPRMKKIVHEDARMTNVYALLIKSADDTLGQKVSIYEIPDGLRLLATSRRVLVRSYTLGLAYVLDGDVKYKDRLWKELEEAANFKDWNPRHFLDTGEMMQAFAVAYDWLYASWSDEQKKVIRTAMIEKGLNVSADAYRGKGPNYGWTRGGNNWNFVCNGGAAIAALALLDEEPDLCAGVLAEAFSSIQTTLPKFEPDGNWYEGPGYWHYSIKYLVPHFASLVSALGTNFGITAAFPGFMKTADFPIYTTGPGGAFNFADAGGARPGTYSAPEFNWFSRELKNPFYTWYQSQRPGNAAENILYYDPSLPATAPAIAFDRYFRGDEAAVISMRSSWDDKTALFAAIKGGKNGVSHGHLDLGSVIVDSGGVRFIEDLGSDNYNMPGYFGGARWTYYRLRAEGHNTILINPTDGPDQNAKAESEVLSFDTNAQSARAVLDMSAAYPDAKKVVRTLSLAEGRSAVRIEDEIVLDAEADLWWFMHTKAQVLLSKDKRTATMTVGTAKASLALESPAGAAFEVLEAKPLPSSPNPPMQGKNNGVRKITVHMPNAKGAVAIRAVFRPMQGGSAYKPLMSEIPAGFTVGGDALIFEAESFTGQTGGNAEITGKIGNSGKSIKFWDDAEHAINWKAEVPVAGDYGIVVRYCGETDPAVRAFSIDGKRVPGEESQFYFPPTGGWSSDKDNWKEVWLSVDGKGVRLSLEKGEHTITAINIGGGGANLDWIKLVPLK